MAFIQTSHLVVLLIAAFAADFAYCDCYNFNNYAGNVYDGWTIGVGLIWQSSYVKDPYTDPIDNWVPPPLPPNGGLDSGYLWLQDQVSPPNTGYINSPGGITINPDDDVSITIYRHTVYEGGETRPTLKFISFDGTVEQSILWSYDYDTWDTVSIRCGPMAEPCCLTYPCTGYFQLDGSILARDELLAVSAIGFRTEGVANTCDCLPYDSDLNPLCP